jgi:hypothetical protein
VHPPVHAQRDRDGGADSRCDEESLGRWSLRHRGRHGPTLTGWRERCQAHMLGAMRFSRISALVALCALTIPAAAAAKSPPRGDYGCTYTTFSGTFFAGTLNIKSKKKYSVNDKGAGRYTTRGKRINFKSGDYKTLYYGKWQKVDYVTTSGFTYEIKLYGKKDGKEKLVCTRDRE